jgi:hypothetical protein
MSGKKKKTPAEDPVVENEDQSGDATEKLGDVDNSPAETASDPGDSEPAEEAADAGAGVSAPEPRYKSGEVPRKKSKPVS